MPPLADEGDVAVVPDGEDDDRVRVLDDLAAGAAAVGHLDLVDADVDAGTAEDLLGGEHGFGEEVMAALSWSGPHPSPLPGRGNRGRGDILTC